jgi:class 3 adenylate cyclase
MIRSRDTRSPMQPLPTGTVTFLFTDIEGSTQMLGNHPQAYPAALALSKGNVDRALALHRESLTLFKEVGEKAGIALCPEGLAVIALEHGSHERVAVLFGAAEALRESLNYPVHPGELAEHQRWIAEASARVSEEAWARAWTGGRNLSLQHAIAVALADGEAPFG